MQLLITPRGFIVSCKVKDLKQYLEHISTKSIFVKEYISKHIQ